MSRNTESVLCPDQRWQTTASTPWVTGRSSTPPIVKGTTIRVDVEHLPKGAGNVNKTLWLWWSGPGVPDLYRCLRAYLHRFDIEQEETAPLRGPSGQRSYRWRGWYPCYVLRWSAGKEVST